MIATDPTRIALRREAHDAHEVLADLVDRLGGVDEEAARFVRHARSALFEAWTVLCGPPEEDDDH